MSSRGTEMRRTRRRGDVEAPSQPEAVDDSSNFCFDHIKAILVITCAIIVSFVLCVIIIIVSTSLNYVEWYQFAFKKNTVTNIVDRDHVYTNGRYFWGISQEALTFNRTYQKVSFRNNDLLVFSGGGDQNNTAAAGLEFSIECDVYYRLSSEKLKDVFSDFGTEYHHRFVDAIRASIKNTAPEFSVNDYVTRRQQISVRIQEELNNDLDELHLMIEPHKFLLLSVKFPSRVLNKFQETVMKKLEIDREILSRVVNLYQKGTEEQIQSLTANITVINQEAEAAAQAAILEAEARGVRIHQEALGEGINRMMERLNISNPVTRAMIFQLYTIQDNNGNGKILIGDDHGIISVGAN